MFKLNTINNINKILYIILLFFIIIFILFCSLNSTATANSYDPALSWKVLKGPFCSIIFPINLSNKDSIKYERIAIQVAKIVDEICPQIALQLGIKPLTNHRFTIILEDFYDYTYGFAITIPHPVIRINLTAPSFNIFDTKFDSWLRILIAHEYTHLAHFEITNNLTSFLRLFLGQIITPNALQPLWSIEGLAIYNESKFSNGGRLWDNRYEMYLRTDFLEGQLKHINQIDHDNLVSWPGGNVPYIYGQSLIHFIVSEYGEEKLIDISKYFSSFPILGMDWSLKKILGINMKELFQKWKNEKKKYYEKQIEEIYNYSEITQSEQITYNKYWIHNPIWLYDFEKEENNISLFYKVFTTNLYPSIRKYDLESKCENILIKRAFGQESSYCFSPDKKYLLYSKLTQYNQYYSFYDLYLYFFNTKKQLKLTEKIRIKDPSWYPGPEEMNEIVAVVNDFGTNNLVLFSLENLSEFENKKHQDKLISFSDFQYLTDFTEGIQVSQPTWSPLGNMIAFSLWYKGYQDIFIMTLNNSNQILSVEPITLDGYTDINPSWSEDGKYLFFSSDRSGVYNLYAYSLPDNNYYRLTNVTTGAFEPSISPDGKEMAFIQYHSSGYELHITKTEQLLWKLIDKPLFDFSKSLPKITNNTVCFSEPMDHDYEENEYLSIFSNLATFLPNYALTDYSPLDSIMPTYWIPNINLKENNLYFGVSTVAQDYLKYYDMDITLAHSLFNDSIIYDFKLSKYHSYPELSFSLSGEIDSFSQLQFGLSINKNGFTTSQDYGRFYTQMINLSLQNKYIHNIIETQNILENRDLSIFSSLNLKYEYDDTEKYLASFSPEIGCNFLFDYQLIFPSLNNETHLHKILFDIRKYFPLSSRNEVFALRFVAGYNSDELNNDTNFKLGGSSSSKNLNAFKADNFPLRGFADSSFIGNHLLLTSLEYRFPIKMIENKIGIKRINIFLEQLSGKLFLDAGHSWNKTILPEIKDINISVGAELDFKLKSKLSDLLMISLGIGKPITEPSHSRVYGRIGFSF